jgi:hypothetical protein
MKKHNLKTWPDVFEATWNGSKTYEYRKNDRDFEVGDNVILEEFIPVGERYTGRQIACIITYISKGPEWDIREGFVVFSIDVYRRRNEQGVYI